MHFTDEERKELESKYSPEFLAKLEACGSAEEAEKLIADQGVELPLGDLDKVSGGLYFSLPNGDEIDASWIDGEIYYGYSKMGHYIVIGDDGRLWCYY